MLELSKIWEIEEGPGSAFEERDSWAGMNPTGLSWISPQHYGEPETTDLRECLGGDCPCLLGPYGPNCPVMKPGGT